MAVTAMTGKETLLQTLGDGSLHLIGPHRLAAIELQKQRRIYITEIADKMFACLFPRPEKARLQEALARHKVAYCRQAHTPGRDEDAARVEAEIGAQFRAIGLPPSYPVGFL